MGVNIAVFVANSSDRRGEKMIRLIQAAIPNAACKTINMHMMVKDYWKIKKGTKGTYLTNETARPRVLELLEKFTENNTYDAFVSVDLALAKYILPERDAAVLKSIDTVGGMLLSIGEANPKPLLLHPDPLHTYARHKGPEANAAAVLMSAFMLKKLANRMQGVPTSEKPIKFTIPRTKAELKACIKIAELSSLIAYDIETSGGHISVVGFACECTKLPYTPVFVIPLFVNIPEAKGDFWLKDNDFYEACAAIGVILANGVYKVAHNGGFDNTHLFRYGWVINNHIFDTMLMMHATWPSVPRALYIGCSLFLDRYRYWKDDGKDVGDDGKVKWQTPVDPEATQRYWYYNGLDCANTLELCLAILEYWKGTEKGRFPRRARDFDYYWRNYVRKFAVEFGPCLYMSCVGIRVDPARQAAMGQRLEEDAYAAGERLRTLIDDPYFNPNSPPQVAELVYDILDITPLARRGRITDKRVLQKFADMHPIINDVISAVWNAKEPANNAAKYGTMPLFAGVWWLYQLKAAATTTARLASSKNNIGYGTNMQNVPKAMRVMCVAEKGEYLVSSDYSQSDSYFVAFESQDENMMTTVTDDRDTHAVHVEFFFGYSYEDVVSGAADGEDWVSHPVFGVRNIIKKVSHGTNYDMGGDTMLLNVRREAAIALVNALLRSSNQQVFMRYMTLDPKKPASYYLSLGPMWSDAQLAKACDFAQRLYYARYPKLAKWKQQAVAQANMDLGVIEMYGGSTTVMLCKPRDNARYVPAAYGQGGTAGNINNAMMRLFYLAQDMWDQGFRMLIQVHDELVCAIPDGATHLIQQKVEIMEHPCVIHGREFVVPVEAEVSKTWDPKNTVVWHNPSTEAELQKFHAGVQKAEDKTLSKLYPKKAIA